MTSVLLVEGYGDALFFEALLRKLKRLDKIKIKPPMDFGAKNNTVTLFPKLIKEIVDGLKVGKYKHFGIVADADHDSGGGFDQRWEQLTSVCQENGYRIPNPPKRNCLGSIFLHPDGLPPIGLWIMPDHQQNGMLEDLIRRTVRTDLDSDHKKLLEKAEICVKKELPVSLFSKHREVKAIIYTWLAWQKRPGQTLDIVINALDNQGLIDLNLPETKGLTEWLGRVFD